MATAEEYQAARGQLRRIVAQGGRRMSLVEFATLPQLREIVQELQAAAPERFVLELDYTPRTMTVPEIVDEARQALADVPAAPLPLLVLRPTVLNAAPEEEAAAFEFWQAMNSRRESWAALPAQILLCVDPWHLRRLVDRAADLWTWLMPKLHLLPPVDALPARLESFAALASFVEFPISPEAAEKQWQTLWPMLEEKSAAGRVGPDDYRRSVFPLFEAALARGNLVRARQVRATACEHELPKEDVVEWHKLNAQLACGEGDFGRAEEHGRNLAEIATGPGDRSMRVSAHAALDSIASLLERFGHAEAAEHLHRQSIAASVALHGAEDRSTLVSRNNLAAALVEQGKYAEAEKEHRAVLAIQKRFLGADHPDALISRSNLANVVDAQGKHAQAEVEHRAVLTILERVLGAEHPDTLISRNNLAKTLDEQGEYAEAEKEQRAVLVIQERVLGAEHPDVFYSCFNLALTQWALGNLRGAASFAQRAAAGWNRVLGSEHPHTRAAEGLVRELKADLTS